LLSKTSIKKHKNSNGLRKR